MNKFHETLQRFNPLEKGDCHLLIRHGEKHLVEDISQDILQPLTQRGLKQAHAFGSFLREKTPQINMKSSPVFRCVQTASEIASGFYHGDPYPKIEISPSLANDGVFIEDNTLSMAHYQHYSQDEIFKKLLSGTLLSGYRNADEGTALLLHHFFAEAPIHGLPLYVTHDYVLTLFVGTLTNALFRPSLHLFDYLEGICLTKETNGKISLYWNNHHVDVTEKCSRLLKNYPSPKA